MTRPAPLVVSPHHVGDEPDWWRRAVVYQVYPRSFADSDGDGIGDIPGLTNRLDHLDELGVDVVWLSPVYRSPQDDNGYDISDYQDIDPLFGSLEDLDALIEGLHARGMRLVMDLVVNHTSDEHPWFTASRSSTQDPKRDWYIWRPARQVDGLAPGQPGTEPTNWGSAFSGSAWAWDKDTQQFYLHLFSPKQPDLNWENPEVRRAVYEMMTWWLERGVDGFRMDVINFISKTYPLTDAPQGEGDLYGNAFAAVANGPRIHEFLHEMNQKVLAPRLGHVITVGEMPGATRSEAALYTDPARAELDMVFQFEHVSLTDGPGGKFDPQPLNLVVLKKNLADWQAALAPVTDSSGVVTAEKGWNSAYWDNHDQPRAVSRFGDDDPAWRVRSAKTLATILHTHRGTPYVYQGEELGMANTVFRSIEDYRDLESINHFHERVRAGDDPAAVLAGIAPVSRDNARTPVHWDSSEKAGFTTGEPWIALAPDHGTVNAAAQVGVPGSVFEHYRRLIALRHDDDAAWRVRSAKTLATILHAHRGTPYIYQGEELGMANTVFRSIDDYRDLESVNHFHERVRAGDDPAAVLTGLAPISRDNARTPVHWDGSEKAGFTTGEPWIALAPDHGTVHAAAQAGVPGSVFEHYRSLIALRHDDDALALGTFRLLAADHPTAWVILRQWRSPEPDETGKNRVEQLLLIAQCAREDLPLTGEGGLLAALAAEGLQAGQWTKAEQVLRAGDPDVQPGSGHAGLPEVLPGWDSLLLRRRG